MGKVRRRWRLALTLFAGVLLWGGWTWWRGRALSSRDRGDQIGDGGGPLHDRREQPGQAPGLEARIGRGRLSSGRVRTGTRAKPGGRRSLGSGRAGLCVLGTGTPGPHAIILNSGQLAAAEQFIDDAAAIPEMRERPCASCSCRSIDSSAASMTPNGSSRPGGNTSTKWAKGRWSRPSTWSRGTSS